nr:SUN domain-containing protein 3-like [Columba livia]
MMLKAEECTRQERQAQGLQSLVLLSSLLLICTGTASFTSLFLYLLCRKMKTLKATMLVLLLGLFSFGVYHVGGLGTLTWSTTGELGELSETLSLPVQLRKLQEQLYHLRWSAKDVAELALQEGVKQAKLPGFTGQIRAVQEIINQALEKLEEIQALMPDYALKSAGAAAIRSKTSPSWTGKAKVFLYSLPVMDYMRSPELILEPENHPGNCWPFPGSKDHVFIKLPVPVNPRAITMDHGSGTAFHGESISGPPKDFALYGFKEEHEEQGQFTFLAALNPSQTFQLKLETEPNITMGS